MLRVVYVEDWCRNAASNDAKAFSGCRAQLAVVLMGAIRPEGLKGANSRVGPRLRVAGRIGDRGLARQRRQTLDLLGVGDQHVPAVLLEPVVHEPRPVHRLDDPTYRRPPSPPSRPARAARRRPAAKPIRRRSRQRPTSGRRRPSSTPTITTPSVRTARSGANRRSRSSCQRRRQRSSDATASAASYTSTTSSQHDETEFWHPSRSSTELTTVRPRKPYQRGRGARLRLRL